MSRLGRACLLVALLGACSALGQAPSRERALAALTPAPVPGLRSAVPRARVDRPPNLRVRPSEPEPRRPVPDETPVRDRVTETPVRDRVTETPKRDSASEAEPTPELVAIAREAFVHARPSRKAPRVGYLRLGERVRRATEPTAGDGCPGGFYRIAPDGYVCVGPTASLDLEHPMATLAAPRPDRDDALPYVYARSKPLPPPLYTRLPSRELESVIEGTARRKGARAAPGWEDVRDMPLPALLAADRTLPTPFGFARGPLAATPARAVQNSGFALLSTLDHDGRRFGLTTDLELVPLDGVTRVRASGFHGLVLEDGAALPVVFVRSRRGLLYSGSPERGFSIARPLAFREGVALGARSALVGGRRYLETRAGDWLADRDLVRIDPPARVPVWAKPGRTWIHVSIGAQTLVAYVGSTPVFATLVSTGADGLADPSESRATPRGEFLIHTKHLTATMSGAELGDEFDLRDVPYVQYFDAGYAFHAAYWHDGFGVPRSHGCVNLSPQDARWLFHFSEPALPRGWHGAFSLREGTLVSVTP